LANDIAVEQRSFESMRGSFQPQRSDQIASGSMTTSGDPCPNAAPLLRQRITAPVVDVHHACVLNLELARTQLYDSYLFSQQPLSKFLLCGGGLGECNGPLGTTAGTDRGRQFWNRHLATACGNLHNTGTYSGRVRY
jgi:hypothetical protein